MHKLPAVRGMCGQWTVVSGQKIEDGRQKAKGRTNRTPPIHEGALEDVFGAGYAVVEPAWLLADVLAATRSTFSIWGGSASSSSALAISAAAI